MPNPPQGHLKALGVLDSAFIQQTVNGHVAGHERQPIGQFKAPVVQASRMTKAGQAQGRLVDRLHRQSPRQGAGGRAGPTAQQVPGAQAKMFRRQQPEADQVAGDLFGQHLADLSFQAALVPGLNLGPLLAAMNLNESRRGDGTIGVEFFFEGPGVR
jgi:hypothetical protein